MLLGGPQDHDNPNKQTEIMIATQPFMQSSDTAVANVCTQQ